tara:strand:+ start:263 stop:475 length:213 start_codon:yes stop_codon:yes gene_type:complete
MTTNNETIKIDDIDYKISELTDECKAEIQSLQFCETEVARLNALLAVAATARNAYRSAVAKLLPNDEAKH